MAEDGLPCSLNIGIWEHPASWGMLLADVARHVSNAPHESRGLDPKATLGKIRRLFEAEVDSPTDEPTGRFV